MLAEARYRAGSWAVVKGADPSLPFVGDAASIPVRARFETHAKGLSNFSSLLKNPFQRRRRAMSIELTRKGKVSSVGAADARKSRIHAAPAELCRFFAGVLQTCRAYGAVDRISCFGSFSTGC